MRVVLDTGILLAALITSGTPPDLIYRAWRKKAFELITSESQLEELRRVSRYQKLTKYLRPAEAGTLVNGLRRQATVLQELPTVELSPDPDDNAILATAISGKAHAKRELKRTSPRSGGGNPSLSANCVSSLSTWSRPSPTPPEQAMHSGWQLVAFIRGVSAGLCSGVSLYCRRGYPI
ncbi:MAG: putative toxin-antitoxin system toxin component, PIN family [Gammaproteobacteria bacterium]|nr:putative toxin-antitoxin system toxin component, PIN family [Gammaproteobacteria bacterium]